MKKGNIVGEPFAKYVNEQIEQRQSFHGSGLHSPRDPKHLQYLNGKTSWVKMASSVFIKEENEQLDTLPEGIKRLENLGLTSIEEFLGQGLARKAVLFNGLSEAKFKEIKSSKDNPVSEFKTEQFNGFNQRSGYSKSNSIWNNQSAYGLGGTDFGLQPMPGITGVEVAHLNRGSIRKATVTLKAYNKSQFELIETLYLRLGYTMLLEWGNSHYIENNLIKDNENNIISRPGDLQQVGNTLVEDFWFIDNYPSNQSHLGVLKKVESYRERYDGNYDGFFGKVSNFNWNFNQDASYDITIDLISLGDVIESLKVNTLISPIKSNELDTDQSELNQTTIQNYFYNIRRNFESIVQGNPDFFNAKQAIKKDTGLLEFGGIRIPNIFRDNGDSKYFYYIRFGKLLDYLEKNILPTVDNQNNPFPIISFDTIEDSNIMSLYPNQFSLDPRVCIINSDYFDPPLDNYPSFFEKLKPFYSSDSDVVCGKIMNIYLNFELVERILKSNTDSKGNLSLFNFLQSICNEVNKSLGSINQLEPIIDEDRNTLVIIDQNTLPQTLRNKLRRNLGIEEEEENSTPFELYGYNRENSTSNFVKSFSFKTEIGPDLSTIISIGATAQGTVVGEDATAFSSWNSGLKDRFQQKIDNPLQSLSTQQIPYTYLYSADDPKAYPNYIETGKFNSEEKNRYDTLEKKYFKQKKLKQDLDNLHFRFRKDKVNKENTQQSENYVFGEGRNEFKKYLIKAWGKNVFSTENFNYQPQYLLSKPKFINQGLKLFTNSYFEKTKELSKPTSSIGFIPVKLSLEVDGISGIKIYQSLKINTKFLPGNYPEVLEFLVTKVNHTLQNNQWVTKIETISQPVIEETKINLLYKPKTFGITQPRKPISELTPSNNFYNILKEEEGFRSRAYDDENPNKELTPNSKVEGTLTIGYGQTTIQPNPSNGIPNILFTPTERPVRIGDTIGQEASFRWVKETKIPNDINIIKNWLKVPLTQNEFDALLLFTYNMGPGSSNKLTFVNLLNNKKYVEAANSLVSYNKTKSGKVLPGLIKRRKREINIWLMFNPGNPE